MPHPKFEAILVELGVAETALSRGRDAILAVPEVALERALAQFQETVATITRAIDIAKVPDAPSRALRDVTTEEFLDSLIVALTRIANRTQRRSTPFSDGDVIRAAYLMQEVYKACQGDFSKSFSLAELREVKRGAGIFRPNSIAAESAILRATGFIGMAATADGRNRYVLSELARSFASLP
jgi:hypothetical protein